MVGDTLVHNEAEERHQVNTCEIETVAAKRCKLRKELAGKLWLIHISHFSKREARDFLHVSMDTSIFFCTTQIGDFPSDFLKQEKSTDFKLGLYPFKRTIFQFSSYF